MAVDTEPTFVPAAPVRLFEWAFNGATGGRIRRMAVSRDGQRFLLLKLAENDGRDIEEPEVVVVLNWQEELKRLVPAE